MEWDAPGIVLSARPFGEGDAIVALLTEAHGRHLGLARGGGGRRQASLWQAGNLVQARWTGRLADGLGSLTAELVHPSAALAMDDATMLAVLTAACAVADGTLPEREAHGLVFAGLLRLIAGLAAVADSLPALVAWELSVLAELGYGLDLTRCGATGSTADLAYVSPRTGRAVSRAAAGIWADRLLPLPAFLAGGNQGADAAAVADGLRLTGHFLARDAFGARNLPLPNARQALYDRVVRLAFTPPPDASHD